MKIGLISDTHDYFDPRLPDLFAGVDHILHAGDIGRQFILDQLAQIAPVTAVLGNTDYDLCLRPIETLELSSRKFLVCHVADPIAPSAALRQRLQQDRPDVVVSGHSHRPSSRQVGGVLFINPGYAGRVRFGLPRSVVVLHCEPGTLRQELVPL